jgi:hypothetical protein
MATADYRPIFIPGKPLERVYCVHLAAASGARKIIINI